MAGAHDVKAYRTSAKLTAVSRLATVAMCLWAFGLLASMAISARSIHADDRRWMIVSAVGNERGAIAVPSNVTSISATEPFARKLLAGAAANPANSEAPERYFVSKPHPGSRVVVDHEVSAQTAKPLLARRLSDERLAGTSLLLPALVLFGLAVGLAFPFCAHLAAPMLASAALLMLAKIFSRCPTCGDANFFGVSADSAAAAAFLAATVATTAFARARTAQVLVSVIVAVAIAWQLYHATELRDSCVPCALAGFFCALVLATLAWRPAGSPEAQSGRKGERWVRRGAWTVAVLIPSVVLSALPDPLSSIGKASSLVGGRAGWSGMRSVADLGLRLPRERAAILVAKRGCAPCEQALNAIDRCGFQGLTFCYAGDSPPDSLRPWTYIPRGSKVPATPSLLLVGASGSIVSSTVGFPTDTEAIASVQAEVSSFLHSRTPEGSVRRK